jgi:hypothetical protein
MFNTHPAGDVFAKMVKDEKVARQAAEADKRKPKTPVLDSADEEVMDSAAEYASADIALKAVAALQEWAETDDMDDGETLATRLSGLMIGIADENIDGEIGEEEMEVLTAALEAAWDYLSAKGVSDEDCSALLNDWDDAAAARVQELLASRLPDGDEAAGDDMDNFVFGDGSEESALDATYKKRIVVRKGKKVRINKRVSGKVRLSAAQKVAIRKMLRRSHSGAAQMRRAKSTRMRKKMGM